MAKILSGLLVEEVTRELLEEVPLPVILPVILYDTDELLLLELSFLLHDCRRISWAAIMTYINRDNLRIFLLRLSY
jgi:hypothetical protein